MLQLPQAKVIYRGDQKSRVLGRFNLTENSVPRPFNDMLFLIGDKGRIFLSEVEKEINSKSSFDISDNSENFFCAIFDMLHKLLFSPVIVSGVQKRIDVFKSKEPDLVTFFQQKNNKKNFFAKVKGSPVNEIILIRDYYLTLLHHIDRSDYYPFSFLLSTTKSFSVAQKFVDKHAANHDEIIFVGWVPQNQNAVLYSPFTASGKQDIVEKHDLPTYKKSFFPYQEEISIKGGLLPHFLIGYFYSDRQEAYFEVNPYFINHSKKNWIVDGLPIDQGEFWNKIKDTQFRRMFYYDPQTGYWAL